MRHMRFAARSMLGLVLTLAAASPAFAGISDFAINGDATLAPGDLQVSVSGTVRCPVGETVSIFGNVVQIVHGQLVASGGGGEGLACTGSVETWTLITTSNIPMHPGPASASFNAFGFAPPVGFEGAFTSAELKLQETH